MEKLHPFAKRAGYKDNESFYQDYPTEQHFFDSYPDMQPQPQNGMMGKQMGGLLNFTTQTLPVATYGNGGGVMSINDIGGRPTGRPGYFWTQDGWKKSKGSTNNGASFSREGGFIKPLEVAFAANGGMIEGDYVDEMRNGGIHIKKSHEGRFTAYKKRTGKTTEEALHSSDPHVRQMANFAKNAKSWKKKYGGEIMQIGGAINLPGDSTISNNNSNDQSVMDDVNAPVKKANTNNFYIDDNSYDNRPKVTSDIASPTAPTLTPPQNRNNNFSTLQQTGENLLGAGLITASYFEDQNRQRQQAAFNRSQGLTDNVFAGQKLNTSFGKGDYTQQGTFRPDQSVPVKPGTYYPQMKYGGNTPGQFNSLDSRWNPVTYQGMSGVEPAPDPYARVGKTLPEVPENEANVNAEKSERVIGNFDQSGLPALMNVDGPPHTDGGKNIAVPDNSFIYSDTKSLKIKDPEVLKLFGATKPSTPATLAAKYDLQKFTKTILDPDSDNKSKETAQMMVDNYTKKLSQLAQVQEGMKNKGDNQIPGMSKYGGTIMQDGGSDYIPFSPSAARLQGYPSASPQTTKDYQQWANVRGAGLKVDNKWGDRTSGWNNPDLPNMQHLPTSGYRASQSSPDEAAGLELNDTHPDVQNMPVFQNIPDPPQFVMGDDTKSNNAGTMNRPFVPPTPDVWGLQNSMLNLATIHHYPAWEAPVSAVTPDTVFADPTRALAAIQENANSQYYNATLSGNMKAVRANGLAGQGIAGDQSADVVSKYNTENVGTANRSSQEAAQITNQLLQRQEQRLNKLYQDGVISNQQYDNALREGRNDVTHQAQTAWNDRSKTDFLNKTSPYFYFDPVTGARGFKSPEAEAKLESDMAKLNQGAGIDPGESKKVAGVAAQYMRENPGLSMETAYKYARQDTIEHVRRTYDPMNPMKSKVTESETDERKYGGKVTRRLGGFTNHQLKKFVTRQFGEKV